MNDTSEVVKELSKNFYKYFRRYSENQLKTRIKGMKPINR